MNKNTFLINKVLSKSNIAILLAVLSVVGFLVSRPLNSLATILFGINALWGIHPKTWLKQKWWWICVVWVATYTISIFWSSNLRVWNLGIDVKLPFLLLPLAYPLLPRFSIKQLLVFTVLLSIAFLAGAGYSSYFYFKNAAYYIHSYGSSGVLPTPVEDDHICFSMAITLFIVWCVYFSPYVKQIIWKWFIGLTVVLLSVFLHLLAVKSGLLALYIFVVCWIIYIAIKKNKWVGVAMITSIAIFVVLASEYIPTFKHRIGYAHYTYEMYKQGSRTGDYSDMGRVISYDIALKLIAKNPIVGVGAGDILDEMRKGYDQWYPNIKNEQRLYPHNQFLTSFLGCGILSVVWLLILVLYPMFRVRKGRQGFFTFVAAATLMVPLMAEPFLEIQFGVFTYLFFLLWIWHAKWNTSTEAITR